MATSADPIASAGGLEVGLAVPPAAKVRQPVEQELSIKNPGRETVAMPTAVVPVPPGFRADPASLEALVRARKIARFEDQGSELHLYLRELRPGARVLLPYKLEAAVECRVTQRAAQAYAYYSPEVRGASAAGTIASSR